MRLIPGKTKVRLELFKGVSLADIAVGGVAMGLMILVFVSNLPGKVYFCVAIAFFAALLLVRFDSEPSYRYLLRILLHFSYKRFYDKIYPDKMLTSDASEQDGLIEALFDSEDEQKNAAENPAKLTKKEIKKLYKEEQKILHSRTATKEEKDAVWLARANRSAEKKTEKKKEKSASVSYLPMEQIMPYKDIKDGFISYGDYYGAVIEIPPVEFRFFSEARRANSIENAVGRVLRTVNTEYSANIVKLERPVLFDSYIKKEQEKTEEIIHSYENGAISEEELKARMAILNGRIEELKDLCFENHVVQPFYYIVLFDSDKKQLDNQCTSALDILKGGELDAKRLNDREIAVFLKYSNEIDFDERDIDKVAPEDYAKWAMPQTVAIKGRTVEVDHIITHNMRVVNYPTLVGDAWMAGLMSIPATKVMIKCTPVDHQKAVLAIDRSLQEIRDRLNNTGIESRRIELSTHAETLSELLATIQGDNENLLSMNVYVTAYDINLTRATPSENEPPKSMRSNITSMKKTVRRIFSESRVRLENMEFNQMKAFIGGQISGYDPEIKDGRGVPSNSIAAAYPWIYANICDKNGVKLGVNDDVPVFLDFFRRDDERVNSNMVIVGKSGSGKSYATKSFLANLAADDAKIFILDPENEYAELACNLHGKIINVGNASHGRLNPFHIITGLEDDENSGGAAESSSYATHLQFLEEFFRQSLPDCEKDALEYLNSLIDRMYLNKGISPETNLSRLTPEDYPTFDDLYDTILAEFQHMDNEYIRTMLRTLMNYISKFSTGGRNANIWNGPSSITTEENFTVFNFQSLLANRNSTIANSQMLLVLKYIDNEIIKNREYNIKYKANRKIVVVIDEAHVFIDTKYPVALDFMFQLAKRIRKYNGMQIVITQNIKDFVGSEEIARKSTAIINACQYSFIFSLSPNDMDDLCMLYEKSGGINEREQEQIVSAPRGQAFAILSPKQRSTFKVQIPEETVAAFSEMDYENPVYSGEEGGRKWEELIGESRAIRTVNVGDFAAGDADEDNGSDRHTGKFEFFEITEEEYEKENARRIKEEAKEQATKEALEEARAEYVEDLKVGVKANMRSSGTELYADDDDDDFIFTELPEFEEEKLPVQTIPAASTAPAASSVPAASAAAPVQQITVRTESNGELESVVMKLGEVVDNMTKMNYDIIMSEVRNMLGNANQAVREGASGTAAPAAEEKEENNSLGSLFDDLFGSSEDEDEDEEEEYSSLHTSDFDDDDEDGEDASGGFDILAYLASTVVEDEEEESPIDRMEEDGATVISISLEELVRYNLKSAKKG